MQHQRYQYHNQYPMSDSPLCPQCDRKRTCSVNSNCWCHDFPPLLTASSERSCLCKDCLTANIKVKVDELITHKKHDEIAALGPVSTPKESIDYTINQDGLLVFTAWYHLRRGYCCGSGCQNCPYGKDSFHTRV